MTSKKRNKSNEGFDEANASVLSDMLVDRQTSEAIRLQIINELNEATKTDTFFEAIFNEALSFGPCPCCGHENHWLVPEDNLSQMGWVTSDKDSRVPRHTDSKTCSQWAEACSKKRVTS